MKRQNQAGFAVVEAVLIVVVLALLGGVGYWVVSKIRRAQQQTNLQ